MKTSQLIFLVIWAGLGGCSAPKYTYNFSWRTGRPIELKEISEIQYSTDSMPSLVGSIADYSSVDQKQAYTASSSDRPDGIVRKWASPPEISPIIVTKVSPVSDTLKVSDRHIKHDKWLITGLAASLVGVFIPQVLGIGIVLTLFGLFKRKQRLRRLKGVYPDQKIRDERKSKFAIWGFVLMLLAYGSGLLLGLTSAPIFGVIALLALIPGAIFSRLGLDSPRRGFALAGAIMAGLVGLAAIVGFIYLLTLLAGGSWNS